MEQFLLYHGAICYLTQASVDLKGNLVNDEDREQPLLRNATASYDAARLMTIISVIGNLSGKVMDAALTSISPPLTHGMWHWIAEKSKELFIPTVSFA